MTEQPVSPLRQRLIEDMMVRNFMEKTRSDYVHHVKTLAAFLKRSPDTANTRGSAPLSIASNRDRRTPAEYQQLGIRVALLLHRLEVYQDRRSSVASMTSARSGASATTLHCSGGIAPSG